MLMTEICDMAFVEFTHCNKPTINQHYSDVIMSAMASQTTGVLIVYSTFWRHRSKITSKLRATGLCEGNSPVTGEFHSQRASSAEIVSIWWRHHKCGYISQGVLSSWDPVGSSWANTRCDNWLWQPGAETHTSHEYLMVMSLARTSLSYSQKLILPK